MAHTVLPTKHPNIAHIQMLGALTHEDMTCDAELGLGTGKPIFLLCDTLHMSLQLPEGFFDSARIGFLVHPDLQHLAVVTNSKLLKGVGLAAATLSSRREKMSMHDSIEDAEAHVLAMIKRRGM